MWLWTRLVRGLWGQKTQEEEEEFGELRMAVHGAL